MGGKGVHPNYGVDHTKHRQWCLYNEEENTQNEKPRNWRFFFFLPCPVPPNKRRNEVAWDQPGEVRMCPTHSIKMLAASHRSTFFL